MPSSTFSSERVLRAVPAADGRATLLVCCLTLAALALPGELLLRLQPARPPLTQSDETWYHRLRSVTDDPGRLDVVFYGSSRTWTTACPDTFDEQMAHQGRTARSWNLGLDHGSSATGLLAHLAEGLTADVVVLEQYGVQFSQPLDPDLVLERYRETRQRHWKYPLEAGLAWSLAKRLLILRDGIYTTWYHPWYLRFETQENGWADVRYNLTSKRLEAQRRRWVEAAHPQRIPPDDARAAQAVYQAYFDRIVESGSRLVVLRYPVDGPLRDAEDEALRPGYHTDFLSGQPRLLYLDANTEPALRPFRTTEYSHLDGETARQFSRQLAVVIDRWLRNEASH